MSRPRRPNVAWPRHPLTGEQFRVSAATKPKLDYLLGHVDMLREGLRAGSLSPEEVDRKLRRLRHGDVTVERACRSYMDSGVSTNTRRQLASWLAGPGSPLAAVELDALDGPRCERWIASAAMRQHTPTSAITYWRRLRAIVRHAASRGWIARTPWGTWRPLLRASAYARGRIAREAAREPAELVRLFGAARALDARRASVGNLPDVEPKCACVALLGLRQGELASLRWPDVDQLRSLVVVRSQKQGGRPKELRADPVLFELLERWKRVLVSRDLWTLVGPVFPSATFSTPGHPRHADARAECLPLALLRLVVADAGLPHPERWSAQSLRDSFATLEAQGHAGDLEGTRERTRHASIASLVRYLRSLSREPAAPGFTLGAGPATPLLPR